MSDKSKIEWTDATLNPITGHAMTAADTKRSEFAAMVQFALSSRKRAHHIEWRNTK